AAAENLQPVLTLADADFIAETRAAHINFHRRLGEGKEARAHAQFHALHLEKGAEKFFQRPFQMAEMRHLIIDKAFDLVQLRRVRLVAVAAIGAARTDEAERRLRSQEHTSELQSREKLVCR